MINILMTRLSIQKNVIINITSTTIISVHFCLLVIDLFLTNDSKCFLYNLVLVNH